MNVVIIEDERLTAERLVSLVKKYDASINVLNRISSVVEAISWFKMNPATSIDLIFMDIHLEDGDSFEIISKLNLKTPIVFTTAFDGYMINAFKVNSVDYLLKPISYEELAAALDKFKSLRSINESQSESRQIDIPALIKQLSQQNNPQFKDRFMVTVGTKIRSIKTESIAYFYLEEKTVFLVTSDLVTSDSVTLPIDYSLDKLMQIVDPRKFFRVSRQFIVSLNSIHLVQTISAGKLKLDLVPRTKHDVTVSGDRISDFKEWLGKD